jgi:hypothetical protein
MYKIANETGTDEAACRATETEPKFRHLHIEFGPVLIGWDFWLWMVIMASLSFKGSACTSHRTETLPIEIEGYNK